MSGSTDQYQIGDLVVTSLGVSVVAGCIRRNDVCVEVITQPLSQLFSPMFYRYPLNQVSLARLDYPPGALFGIPNEEVYSGCPQHVIYAKRRMANEH